MTTEQFEKATELAKQKKELKEREDRIEKQIALVESVPDEIITVRFYHNNHDRNSYVDKNSFIDFLNSQAKKTEREITKIDKKFEKI